jgi:fatty acid-binding protein DegV
MPGHVAVVTDSAACLTGELARTQHILVVPLRVQVGGAALDDGPAALPEAMQAQLRDGQRLTTSRPAPGRFAAAYASAAAAGAAAIVSVHLSGQLSGTVSSAALAAADAPVPVRVVDSRSIGMGLGLAVLAAAAAAWAGQSADDVAAVAARCSAQLGSFFALDTADYLRAAGRLGTPDQLRGAGRPGTPDQVRAAGGPDIAAVPPAGRLIARPLLQVRDGRIAVLERVRTLSSAAIRLEELAVEFAAGRPVDLAVQHLGNAERAARLAERLAAAIPLARHVYLAEAGLAIGAHTGPCMLGVALAPC